MDNENPFGTFQPEPQPIFENPTSSAAPADKPRRKYTRKAKAAPTTPAEKPTKRKYARRATDPAPAAAPRNAARAFTPDMLVALVGLSESEMGVIARIFQMPGVDLARIGKALQKLGAA